MTNIPRQEPIILSELIATAASELSKSNLVAALEIHKMFLHIANEIGDSDFDQGCCWVRGPKEQGQINSNYTVSPMAVARYINNCMFERTVPCRKFDGAYEDVQDDFIVFYPPSLMALLNSAGYAWVPRRGLYLHSDVPVDTLPVVPAGSLVMPYETAELQAMHAAASKFWVEFDRSRPPLQKTVSSFLAEQLKLNGSNRKTDALAAAIRPADAPSER